MNTTITSREAILSACRELVRQEGLSSLSIRAVAGACGISIGSVYNYFPSKTDLIICTVEDIFSSIFNVNELSAEVSSFPELIVRLFTAVRTGTGEYPVSFLSHSMSFAQADKEKGRDVMQRQFEEIKKCMKKVMEQDKNIRSDAFNETFTKDAFLDFVFSNLLSCLLKNQDSCSFLVEIVKRAIY